MSEGGRNTNTDREREREREVEEWESERERKIRKEKERACARCSGLTFLQQPLIIFVLRVSKSWDSETQKGVKSAVMPHL